MNVFTHVVNSHEARVDLGSSSRSRIQLKSIIANPRSRHNGLVLVREPVNLGNDLRGGRSSLGGLVRGNTKVAIGVGSLEDVDVDHGRRVGGAEANAADGLEDEGAGEAIGGDLEVDDANAGGGAWGGDDALEDGLICAGVGAPCASSISGSTRIS